MYQVIYKRKIKKNKHSQRLKASEILWFVSHPPHLLKNIDIGNINRYRIGIGLMPKCSVSLCTISLCYRTVVRECYHITLSLVPQYSSLLQMFLWHLTKTSTQVDTVGSTSSVCSFWLLPTTVYLLLLLFWYCSFKLNN